MTHFYTCGFRTIVLMIFACTLGGCTSSWKPAESTRPRTESVVVDHQTEGTHRRLEVRDDVWYQLSGTTLLAIDGSGRTISRTQLALPGTSPSASDLIVMDDEIVVLLGDAEIVRLDRSSPWRPIEVDRIDGQDLGFWPTSLTHWEGEVIALGQGAARTLDGGLVVRSDGEVVTSLVEDGGRLLFVSGRRIHRRAGGEYLGTASLLEVAEPHRNLPDGALLFTRHERAGSLIGFLGADCRELDTEKWTTAVTGTILRVRQQDGQILVVSDTGLGVFRLTGSGLIREWWKPLEGVQDADWLDSNHLVVAGTFGRGIVPLGAVDPITSAVHWTAAPAGLLRAGSDGERLIAESAHGRWAYQIGQNAIQIDESDMPLPPPATKASVLGWSIEINNEGQAVLETPAGPETFSPPGGGRFSCVASSEDAFWLGHDRGILLLMLAGIDKDSFEARQLAVLIDGPVICIEPLMLGGGVAYASEHGGFGVIREVY
ncbi:MAG: hypothetical protein P8I91_09205 [Phycisphaerales bacterium]|nr:hypothetical protein [Phycisphaerales bacterium]